MPGRDQPDSGCPTGDQCVQAQWLSLDRRRGDDQRGHRHPRLQVCCYLSRIRTELHYRQVLGRVLRRMGESDDQAWLFMLAEPTLRRFAERIADDLPDDLAVLGQVQMAAALLARWLVGWGLPAISMAAVEARPGKVLVQVWRVPTRWGFCC